MIARSHQAERLIDLLELVGSPGAVALALGLLDVGVVDMLVEPGLVDLFALGANFHAVIVAARRPLRHLPR
jgi:hypothetical protein